MFPSRPATRPLPALPAESRSGLVIDIGGTKLLVGAARQGEIARRRSFAVSQFAGPADMMDVIAATGRQLCQAAGVPVSSAVVAVAGRLDRASGTVVHAANLPFTNFPLAAELSRRLDGADVCMEHDAVCGLIGETVAGAARGFANVVYLTVSTGISVGILIDGALLEGAHGAAGELGHTPVEWPGIACGCGSSGCLEAYASGRALAALGQQAAAGGTSPPLAGKLAAGVEITARDVLAAARSGDRASASLVDNAIELLARAIRLLLMTLDPDVVVLGGGVMSNSWFAGRLARRAAMPPGRLPLVRRARLGDRSVMHGGMLFLRGRDHDRHLAAHGTAATNGASAASSAAGKGAP
jgi:glucokinase